MKPIGAHLPPLPQEQTRFEDMPEECALCNNSGWRSIYELVTWRPFGPVIRERINSQQFTAFAPKTEGIGRRDVYRSIVPCKCSKGRIPRVSYAEYQRIEREKRAEELAKEREDKNEDESDGKSRAGGE